MSQKNTTVTRFFHSISALPCFPSPQAISDLLLGVFCMPFTLVGQVLRKFIFGSIMCKLIPYFQGEFGWIRQVISVGTFYRDVEIRFISFGTKHVKNSK